MIATKQQDTLPHQKQLEKERDHCLMQIHQLQAKVVKLGDQILKLKENRDTRSLSVTDHAFDRFKERVMDIPQKRIRQILTGKELLEAYKRKGDGRYGLSELPHVIVAIENYCVITVINTMVPEERLKVLSKYMEHFIDELALKYTGRPYKALKLKTFRNLYYRNQTKTL